VLRICALHSERVVPSSLLLLALSRLPWTPVLRQVNIDTVLNLIKPLLISNSSLLTVCRAIPPLLFRRPNFKKLPARLISCFSSSFSLFYLNPIFLFTTTFLCIQKYFFSVIYFITVLILHVETAIICNTISFFVPIRNHFTAS